MTHDPIGLEMLASRELMREALEPFVGLPKTDETEAAIRAALKALADDPATPQRLKERMDLISRRQATYAVRKA